MPCTIAKESIENAIAFHGHSCPGLSIGIRAAELALNRLGSEADLVAVTETDMCGVDAIQFLTDCTLGKGNLIHRDYGKMAFSFFDRKSGKGFRALLRPETRAGAEELGRQGMIERFMTLDLDEMFAVTELMAPAPRAPRILETLACELCGETVMESRTRRFGGKHYCIPCFDQVDQKL